MLLSFVLFPIFALAPQCHSAKFLFTYYHDKGSHFGSVKPMIEKLVQRGHNVTILDTIFERDASSLFRHVRAKLPHRTDEEWKRQFAHLLWEDTLSAEVLPVVYIEMDHMLGTLVLNHSRQVVELVDEDWDFIVIDDLFWSFGFALTVLKHRLWELNGKTGRQPHIVVYATAASALYSAESTRATGRNWVSRPPVCPFVPDVPGDAMMANRFLDRLHTFRQNAVEFLALGVVEMFLMPNIAKFGVPNFSWYEMFSRSTLQLSDSIDQIGLPTVTGPEVFNVGAHCKSPKELPREFAKFMEDPGSKGTIYLAFGTHADWSMAPRRVLDAMLGALNRLADYRIIFVYNGPPMAELGQHVLLTKWAPQLEVLAHRSMRAFVTHAGNKSIREALCSGVPMVLMPIFAEQPHSAHLMLSLGIAPVINKFTMTDQKVFEKIHKVVTDPESAVRAQKLRAIFLDRPMAAMDQGAFALERLSRKRGDDWNKFTQRRGMHLGWPEFVYLDLLALILLSITIISIR